MAENVLERMERIGAKEKIKSFMEKERQSYEWKVQYAEDLAYDFVRECKEQGRNYHVSVGGLDSIILLCFLRSIGLDPPAISVSYLEDMSIQKVHRALGVERLKSAVKSVDENGRVRYWSKPEIIQEFGFPVLSKEIAAKIELLQNPTEKNATVRHAIITGETGEYGGFQTDSRMKLAKKWLERFGGYENETEHVNYLTPNFLVSSKCCYYLKEKPCDDWAKEHNSVPFLGLMASEGGRRAKSLRVNGCNYWGSSTVRSCPFAIFSRPDVLRLGLELGAPVPEIYGEISTDKDGKLCTTKAQRTGCSMCGFGIHMEKRPHRFDLLRERNEKEWTYWMYNVCTDKKTGEKYGWGRVLDWIGVDWEDRFYDYGQDQISLFDTEDFLDETG